MTRKDLAQRHLTYAPAGASCPADEQWRQRTGPRPYQRTVLVGHGDDVWRDATSALWSWGVKTRSGFTVVPADGGSPIVRPGADYWLIAGIGPIRVREPARVVVVVETPDRCGFAYGTLEGHPVSGEEAFVLHRDAEGAVFLTLRSLTRAGRGRWRMAFPAVLVAQRWYRARYARALLSQS